MIGDSDEDLQSQGLPTIGAGSIGQQHVEEFVGAEAGAAGSEDVVLGGECAGQDPILVGGLYIRDVSLPETFTGHHLRSGTNF